MEIVIKIPKEFENHFNSDKFEDSLQRVRFDVHKAIIAKKDILSGNYEIETLDMLTEAFLKYTPLPKGHGRMIDENELIDEIVCEEIDGRYYDIIYAHSIYDANTIIEADKAESEE